MLLSQNTGAAPVFTPLPPPHDESRHTLTQWPGGVSGGVSANTVGLLSLTQLRSTIAFFRRTQSDVVTPPGVAHPHHLSLSFDTTLSAHGVISCVSLPQVNKQRVALPSALALALTIYKAMT